MSKQLSPNRAFQVDCSCNAAVRNRMLTYDIVCRRTTSYADIRHRMLTYDIVCRRTTSYADVRHRMRCYNYFPFLTLCCLGRRPFLLQEGTCLLNETHTFHISNFSKKSAGLLGDAGRRMAASGNLTLGRWKISTRKQSTASSSSATKTSRIVSFTSTSQRH